MKFPRSQKNLKHFACATVQNLRCTNHTDAQRMLCIREEVMISLWDREREKVRRVGDLIKYI